MHKLKKENIKKKVNEQINSNFANIAITPQRSIENKWTNIKESIIMTIKNNLITETRSQKRSG